MSKIFIYGDIHHGHTIGKLGKSGLDLRIEDTLEVEHEATQYCLDHGITIMGFTGDRTLTSNPPMWLVSMLDEVWALRISKGISIHALMGNHDLYKLLLYGSAYSSLWNGFDNFHLYKNPGQIKIEGRVISFLPFGCKPSQISQSGDIIFFHDEVQGVTDDRGYKAPSGSNAQGLKLKELEQKGKLLIGGHIHAKGSFSSTGIYVGAPIQFDETDIGKLRGFHVLNLDDLSLEFIESKAPKLVRIIVKDLNELNIELAGKALGNYMRCNVKAGLEEDVKAFLRSCNARHFVVSTIVEKGLLVETIARKIYKEESPEAAIAEFVRSRDLPDRDGILETGLKLWREYKEVI